MIDSSHGCVTRWEGQCRRLHKKKLSLTLLRKTLETWLRKGHSKLMKDDSTVYAGGKLALITMTQIIPLKLIDIPKKKLWKIVVY